MQVKVSGKQLDVGNALQEHASDQLSEVAAKYFDQATDANVVFSKDAHRHTADITINLGTGTNIIVQGHGAANEVYAAFEDALQRIAKQMRRYKRRLKDHHQKEGAATKAAATVMEYVMEPENDNDEELPIANDAAPAIIAEMPKDIQEMAVSEAVMRLDLSNQPLFLFHNKKTGKLNIVYRRHDGNIGWVDPNS